MDDTRGQAIEALRRVLVAARRELRDEDLTDDVLGDVVDAFVGHAASALPAPATRAEAVHQPVAAASPEPASPEPVHAGGGAATDRAPAKRRGQANADESQGAQS